ncbi:hypothetical protein PINS_up019059 [Pythium insidiosum]|nr:hypothetical protein PINS_up019059 [Pythium insidiosum]
MAETVVLLLRDLARRGRTVVATIHQPASDLFALFDSLYLLADGRTVYAGAASDSVTFFGAQGLPCPAFTNPSDFFMKQLVVLDSDVEAKQRVERLAVAWAATAEAAEFQVSKTCGGMNTDREVATSSGTDVPLPLPLHLQLRVLWRAQRAAARARRRGLPRARGVDAVRVAALGARVPAALARPDGRAGLYGRALLPLGQPVHLLGQSRVRVCAARDPARAARARRRTLHAVTWYVAKNVSELLFQALFPLLFLVPAYFLVGFPSDAAVFFSFYAFIASVASSAVGLGYMVSCLTARVDLAPLLGVLFILPSLLFGGLFLNAASTPSFLVWLQQLSPIKYAFHGTHARVLVARSGHAMRREQHERLRASLGRRRAGGQQHRERPHGRRSARAARHQRRLPRARWLLLWRRSRLTSRAK